MLSIETVRLKCGEKVKIDTGNMNVGVDLIIIRANLCRLFASQGSRALECKIQTRPRSTCLTAHRLETTPDASTSYPEARPLRKILDQYSA